MAGDNVGLEDKKLSKNNCGSVHVSCVTSSLCGRLWVWWRMLLNAFTFRPCVNRPWHVKQPSLPLCGINSRLRGAGDKRPLDNRASAVHRPILCIVYQYVIHSDRCFWESLLQSIHGPPFDITLSFSLTLFLPVPLFCTYSTLPLVCFFDCSQYPKT